MIDLIIDEEFKNLIPPLSDSEISQLEENILQYGIQDPLKVWNGTLIDGHNRYSIAQKHNLTFNVEEMNFDSRADVISWIVKNQFGRRNISTYDRVVLALKLKPLLEKQAAERKRAGVKIDDNLRQNSDEGRVDVQIAKIAGVSKDTVRKIEKIEECASQDVKKALKNGEISIHSAFMTVKNKKSSWDLKIAMAKELLKAKFNGERLLALIEEMKRRAEQLETEDPDEYAKLRAGLKEQGLNQKNIDFIREKVNEIDEEFLTCRLYEWGVSEDEVNNIRDNLEKELKYVANLSDTEREQYFRNQLKNFAAVA